MLTLSNHSNAQKLFAIDEALLSISQAGGGKLVNMFITLESHGIFGLKIGILIYFNISKLLVCNQTANYSQP